MIVNSEFVPFPELTTENHVYRLHGYVIPSTTALMRPLTDGAYAGIPDDILAIAKQRGTEVHDAVEFYIKTGIQDIRAAHRPYLDAFLAWEKEYKPEYLACEYPVYNKFILYGGRIDISARINGKIILIDVKTNAKPNVGHIALQLEAYRLACESHSIAIDDVAGLSLGRDGLYDYLHGDDFPTQQEAFRAFEALVTINCYGAKWA